MWRSTTRHDFPILFPRLEIKSVYTTLNARSLPSNEWFVEFASDGDAAQAVEMSATMPST